MKDISYISGYKIMWLFVLFDLPTETQENKKDYREFRNLLLDSGFTQLQYSVYIKCLDNKTKQDKIESTLNHNLPPQGNIIIFSITDKQYGSIKSFIGKKKKKNNTENQLALF